MAEDNKCSLCSLSAYTGALLIEGAFSPSICKDQNKDVVVEYFYATIISEGFKHIVNCHM